MKTACLVWALILAALAKSPAQSLPVEIRPSGAQLELSWPGSLFLPSGRIVYPLFQMETSSDLGSWNAMGPVLKGGSSDLLRLYVDPGLARSFYRLQAQLSNIVASPVGQGGAAVLGYDAALQTELQAIGQISPEEFQARYAVASGYLPAITWDPTTATYWDRFATDPATNNIGLSPTDHGYRAYDYRLNDTELAVLRRAGFVVSERFATDTFAESFYRLWNDDLPVFVSADALLHAWHRSYDNMLTELENFRLFKLVGGLLDGMAAHLATANDEAAGGPLEPSVLDADYFLTVARSLYAGRQIDSVFGQNARVTNTLAAIEAEDLACLAVFDFPRRIDFSQFKPRGHYESSPRLARYFKTVMWLGRVDLRIAGDDQDCDGWPLPASIRQLGTAIVLGRLLDLAGQFEQWREFEEIIQTFVGMTDSLTFAQLADLMTAAGIHTLGDVASAQALADLQEEIEAGTLGVQNIRSEAFMTPLGPARIELPRCFTVLGQKFVLDSWALTQVVFDAVLWGQDGTTNEVIRRVPSCLDVAFGVLRNNHVVPELVARINNAEALTSTNHSVHWRDGMPYQHNLAAVREVIESQQPDTWRENIYVDWLATLRELSAVTTDASFPEAVRTREWAMRTLNTQLASWTQLRHDTLLYAKQSYTFPGICEYPDGYVDPQIGFWQSLEQMALRTADMIRSLPYGGIVGPDEPYSPTVDLGLVQSNQVRFLTNFAAKASQLRQIAEQELRQEPLNPDQLQFIDSLMQIGYTNYTEVRVYDGWYPTLFYRHTYPISGWWDWHYYDPINYGATKYDALVADVHTDVPDPLFGDPGGVLHQGVGKVYLLFLVVDSGTRRTMFAGPVLSHFEWETLFPVRKTDIEWKEDIANGQKPQHPPWTEGFLVPQP